MCFDSAQRGWAAGGKAAEFQVATA